MSEYSFYDTTYVPRPFPSYNMGAICWCNSLVQVLLGLPALNKLILARPDVKNPLWQAYASILRDSAASRPPPSAGALILDAMRKTAAAAGRPLQLGNSEECADEALTIFIDLLGEEIGALFTNVYELNITCPGCKRVTSTIRDNAYRIQLFTDVNLTTEREFCEYLRAHRSICEYYKCSCGASFSNFPRDERLRVLREIVIVVFNKFHSKDIKWFPQQLKFKSTDNTYLVYRLVGKIEHVGSMFGGHYYAHSLRGDTWYKLNDTHVGPGDPDPSPNTFMIAYHLVREDGVNS